MKLDLAGRREIRAARRRLQERLESLGVLEKLSDPLRRKLLDQVHSADFHYALRERLGPYERRVDKFFKRGPGQLRRLRSQIEKLKAAFNNVRASVVTIAGDDTTPSGNFYLMEALHKVEFPRHLSAAATALRNLKLPPDDLFNTIPGHRTGADDPTQPLTRFLFEFFTAECGLSRNEASQRIAIIGNALWGWNIRCDDPHSHTPNRSTAIRKRVKRHASRNR